MARGGGQSSDQAETILYGRHHRRTPSFMPEMLSVTSSNLDKVGYDPACQALHVIFNTSQDKCYVWTEVPEEIHHQLMNAESKGKFLNSHLVGRYHREILPL